MSKKLNTLSNVKDKNKQLSIVDNYESAFFGLASKSREKFREVMTKENRRLIVEGGRGEATYKDVEKILEKLGIF